MIFGKKQRDIEFVDTTRLVYQKIPVQLAREVKPKYFEEQKKNSGKILFSHCPGMFDQYKFGYIIPAWTDIHIKANKAGCVVILGGSRGSPFLPPTRMNSSIVDGIFKPEGIDLSVWHVPSPWSVQTKKDISALVNSPVFHWSFNDDIHVWPGIVDYKNFSTINFIFSPKRGCEITIPAGEPLLHVMPFFNKDISGGFGPATQEQIDSHKYQIVSSEKQSYRKRLQTVKKFFLND